MVIFRSNLRQHRGEDFQPEIFLIAQTVGATRDDPYLVVEPFDEAESDLVLGLTVGGDAIPMTLDPLSELLVRLQALPLEACPPVIEELARPGFTVVVPELTEGLLEPVGGVQALIRRPQFLRAVPVRFCGCESSVYC